MSASIHPLHGFEIPGLDIPADEILEDNKGECKTVFLMGHKLNGDFFIDSTTSDRGQFLMAMEQARRLLVDIEMGMASYKEGDEDGYDTDPEEG